jgi:hypothetical protein
MLEGIEAIGEGLTTTTPRRPCINVYINLNAKPDLSQLPKQLGDLPVVIIPSEQINKCSTERQSLL